MPTEPVRPAPRCGHRLFPAGLVIAIGVFFLLGNFGIDVPFFDQGNWWAWFILFGAAWPLFDAMERYRTVGAVDGDVLHSLLAATAIGTVALMFLLQLSWQQWWPVFLIYGGLCMLLRRPRRRWRDDVR